MTQYNTLRVKLSNSQLSKLKSTIKSGTEVTLNPSSNLIGNSNDKTNFPNKLLLTDTQVSKICKAFANGLAATIKLSKTQSSKMILSGGILGELIAGITQLMFLTGKEVLRKGISLTKDAAPTLVGKATEYYANKEINKLNKKVTSSKGLGITQLIMK